MESSTKTKIIELLDYLEETEQKLMLEIILRFVPDDIVLPDDFIDGE